jgi:hypothetical protein
MNMQLVVVRPFGGLTRGDIVTDPKRIAQILTSEYAHAVVRVTVPSGKEA